MTSTPTQSERADFSAFCRNATEAQLDEIARKEAAANRHAYAAIARAELEARKCR